MNNAQHDAAQLATPVLPADLHPSQPESQGLDSFRGGSDADTQQLDSRKLCILGLPWDTTDEELYAYFQQFGPLESAVVIKKGRGRDTESRGFGFVTYINAQHAQSVLSKPEHELGGRHIDARQAVPRDKANPNRATRLFIGKLSSEVTDLTLREHFENFGRVTDCYIPKDASNGKQGHRGFGFVTFSNADEVDQVLQCTHNLKGCNLAIQCAVPKDKTLEIQLSQQNRLGDSTKLWPFQHLRGQMSTGGPGSYSSNDSATIAPMRPDFNAVSKADQARRAHAEASTSGRDHPYTQSRLGGAHLLDHSNMNRAPFSRAIGQSPQHSNSDYANASRHGDAEAYSVDAAAQGLQGLNFGDAASRPPNYDLSMILSAQGSDVGTDSLRRHPNANAIVPPNPAYPALPNFGAPRVQPGPANSLRAFQNPAAFQMSGFLGTSNPGFAGFNPRPNAGGQSPAPGFGAGGELNGPPSARAGPRIFVGKLNKDITENDIKEYMTKFGYVLDVYMPRDKEKRTEHRGFGFVTFETPEAIARVHQHGHHRIKGSQIVIDTAAPRKEEARDVPELDLSGNPAAPSGLNAISTTAQGLGQTGRLDSGVAAASPVGSPYINGLGAGVHPGGSTGRSSGAAQGLSNGSTTGITSPNSVGHGSAATPRVNSSVLQGIEQQQHDFYSGLDHTLQNYGTEFSANQAFPGGTKPGQNNLPPF